MGPYLLAQTQTAKNKVMALLLLEPIGATDVAPIVMYSLGVSRRSPRVPVASRTTGHMTGYPISNGIYISMV